MGLLVSRLFCSCLLVTAMAPPPAANPPAASVRQSPPTPTVAVAPPSSPSTDSDYVIGPHDVLTITVFNEPDLSGPFQVDGDGTITYPLIGRVTASGLTSRTLEDHLRTLLGNGYLKQPQVRVEVGQYRSQSVFVIGEVRAPGRYPLTGEMTLIEALAAAGSLSSSAGTEVLVVHSTQKTPPAGPVVPGADQTAEVTHINVLDLQTGRLSANIPLHDGDTIFVPKAETFYVTGQVKNPGAYVLQPGMTVLQAIALAGGLTDRGSNRRLKIVRFVNGEKQEIDVEQTALMQSGDTLVVPQRFF